MIQRIETAFRRLRRWISRSEWAVNILRLPRDRKALSAEHGLIMLQIDGLARAQFRNALESGRLPFLKSLIDREHYQAHSMYSGLPSSTPAVQGELFYGVRSAVPAFQFVDHASGELRVMFDQPVSGAVEKRIETQAEGLLAGGSSYCNIYSGGAKESHFCAASMGLANFLSVNPSPLRLALIALMNLPSLARIGCLMGVETILAVSDAFRGIVAREDLVTEIRFVPVRVGVCILLRELIGISVRMDIARGFPVIHANFLGFDEQAHRRGPDSLFAHWTLLGIDRAIGRIAAEAKRSGLRHYDVWVYSDHGQEKVTPFEKQTGRSLDAVVHDAFERIGFTMDRCNGCTVPEAHRTTRGRRQLLYRHDAAGPALTPAAGPPRPEIQVAAMGPVGHVYCRKTLFDAEKALLAMLVTRSGRVPMALFLDAEQTLIACDGEQCVPMSEHRERLLGAAHPFLDEVVEDLRGLCAHPDAGQLVLCGFRNGEPPVTFPQENGSHAGPGPNETHGFALLPDDTALPTRDGDHLRPIDLRHAALHFLGRRQIIEPFYIKSARAEKTRQSLRIMTYNVHRCLGTDGKLSPQRIARVIAQYAPDIVALQELDVGRARSLGEDQALLIAEHLEMEFHFHPAMHLEEERYGDAILTHHSMELVKAGILPRPSGATHLEPRGALWTRIAVDGHVLNVVNTHLGLRPEERRMQVDALLGHDWLSHPDCRGAAVLCGDFNLMPTSRVFKRMTAVLADAQATVPGHQPRPTFFSQAPVARIDHILVNSRLQVLATHVPVTSLTRVASDHLPLIADIRMATPDGTAPTAAGPLNP